MKVYLRHMPSAQSMGIIPGPPKPPCMWDPVLATASSGPTKGHRCPGSTVTRLALLCPTRVWLYLVASLSFPGVSLAGQGQMPGFFKEGLLGPTSRVQPAPLAPPPRAHPSPFTLHPSPFTLWESRLASRVTVRRWGFLPAPPLHNSGRLLNTCSPSVSSIK